MPRPEPGLDCLIFAEFARQRFRSFVQSPATKVLNVETRVVEAALERLPLVGRLADAHASDLGPSHPSSQLSTQDQLILVFHLLTFHLKIDHARPFGPQSKLN